MSCVLPDFQHESLILSSGGWSRVVGVDEAGRGPLAGPVTAAAVRLDPARIPKGLRDSKLLSPAQREMLYSEIVAVAEFSVAHATVEEIDTLNILRASHLAMQRAVAALGPHHALIDGNMIPRDLCCSATAIVRGDMTCLSIAAASIIAKVTRDRLMVDLAQQCPGYGWHQNAGYSTKAHLEALVSLGVTPWHRRSFRPVHNILYQVEYVSS